MHKLRNVLSGTVILLLISLVAGAVPQGRDAWSYSGDNIPEPSSILWEQATLEQKSAISYIDSNRWETRLTTGHNQTDYQMYRFNVMRPINEITNLSVKWTGYGENQADYDVYLYIWNQNSNSWEQLDTKHLAKEGNLNGSITTGIGSYIDGSGFVYIAAGARHYNYAPPTPTGLSASVNDYNMDVTISWSPVVDQDGDNVQYYVDVSSGYDIANSGWINATSQYFFSNSFMPGYDYTYRVKARDTFSNAESSFATGSFGFKSSCPFVYGWNGTAYQYQTDLEGQVIGAPFFKVKDYRAGLYDMGAGLKPDNGTYKLKVRETIAEADYFDEAKLWVVDVPEGYSVYTDWHDVYIPGLPVTYNLYTVKNPKTPVSAEDKFGRNVTKNLEEVDDNPVNETLSDTNYYTLDFGKIEHPEYAKLIVYGWNAFLKRDGDLDPYKNISSYHEQNTIIEVMNASGGWQKVREFGRLAGDLKPTVFNISNIWLTDDRRIRISPAYSKFATMVLDKVELDDSEPVPVEVSILKPSYADLHHGGSDSYIYPDLNHRLHAYDVKKDDSAESYFFGNFTKYGDVLPLLQETDDKFVIIRHGDELKLEFPAIKEKKGSSRKLFLYADVYYSIKSTVDKTFLRDTVEPLPFHGMSKYPYDTSVENYPYDESHKEYLKEWNTRVCEKGMDYCYDAKTRKKIDSGYETLKGLLYRYIFPTLKTEKINRIPGQLDGRSGSGMLPRSLNSNYVELRVNNQIIGDTIANLSSASASSSSFIFWDNDVASNNRVYYGLNEADVNNQVNGTWSLWNNNTMRANIRLTGLAANTTYYYMPQSQYSGTVNNSVPIGSFTTLRPGVWVSPAESMVSPAGWIGTPANFRTINISAAILNNTGHYIPNLSPEAVIYNSTGSEIGRINLTGTFSYSGNFTLPDYLDEGGYVVRITGYSLAGEFSVLKRGCDNCHTGPGSNYPSTFNAAVVHAKHFDTTIVNTIHPDEETPAPGPYYDFPVTSTLECGNCHAPSYPFWVGHPSNNSCNSCHKSPSNTSAALICEDCHNDRTANQNVLSERNGLDKHVSIACSICHGNLTSLNAKPGCASCHPRQGSNLLAVPDSIENMTHSANQTVACGLCHNREHDIISMTTDARDCRNCHSEIAHDNGAQCTTCHLRDPHGELTPADRTSPSTTIALSGVSGNNSWYTSDVQVTLNATDNEGGSGVNQTVYSLDGVNWSTYTAPFTIADEGIITVYYRSTDNMGNTELTRNQTINVDKTPPVISINIPVPYGLYIAGMTLDFSATDMYSGVADVSGNLTNTSGESKIVTNGSIPEVGVYTLVVNATDIAGNAAINDSVFFVVYDPAGGSTAGGGWFNSDSSGTLPGSRVNFGFEAKYRNESSTGNLEFHNKDADIDLKSTAIDWLVISNTSAEFQGTGTINRMGQYTFRVLADNSTDHFSIKVWNGTDTSVDPYHIAGNLLDGGNIIIHR